LGLWLCQQESRLKLTSYALLLVELLGFACESENVM